MPETPAPTPLPTDTEPVWSRWLAEQMGGIAEYRLECGSRVDIQTETLSIECDWVKKWPESIGQAVYYANETGSMPAVLLLLRGKDTEAKYLERAKKACTRLGVALFTWVTR